MRKVVLLAIFFLSLIMTVPSAIASSFLIEYPDGSGAILSSLPMNGLMYSIGTWNNSMVVIELYSNGSPRKVLLYKPPEGYLYPRVSVEINGSIFIAGDYHVDSNLSKAQPFLMKISSDGKVMWTRIYSTGNNSIAGAGAIITNIIPAGNDLILLGTTTDMRIVMLKVSLNGTPINGVLYSGDVGFFDLNGIGTNAGFLISGSTSKGWAFFMGVNDNLTPTLVEAFNVPKTSVYVDLIRWGKNVLAIIQSGNALFINNFSALMNSSKGKVFILPASENPVLKVIGVENGSVIFSTVSASPPAVLVVTPKKAYYFNYGNMTRGLIESAILWNNTVYFFLQRDFRGKVYLFKGPALGYRWPPVSFEEIDAEALGEYFLVPEELEITANQVNITSENLPITTGATRLDVRVLEVWYELWVRSNPSGANVSIDNIYYGQTPTAAYLLSGVYNVSVVKSGYYAQNAEINVSRDLSYFVNLTPMNGTLIVQSIINGSVLWLNGRRVGYINGTLSFSLRPGNYTVTVTKRDYLNFISKVNLKPGGRLKVIVRLIPLNGTLEVFSSPAGAEVYVNGTYEGKTPLKVCLQPGNYTVTLHLANYSPIKAEVAVRPNQTLKRSFKLTPLNGTLVVNGPANASVYINGELRGKTPLKLSLPPGKYLVNVTKNGLWNATRVDVKPNATSTVALTIPKRPSTGWLPLVGVLIVATIAGGYVLWRKGGAEAAVVTEGEGFIEVRASRAFGISHVGARDNNEDNLLVMKLSDAYLLAVADGLGGHNAGEVASKIAVDTLKEVFEREYRKGMGNEEVKELLKRAHELAHERILENATGDRKGMGTTLVSAFVRDGKIIVANTGDSRAWLIRNGKIVERTKDHSLIQELLDKGEITPEEAKRHPMKNIITKALGVDFGVDLYEWSMRKGDILLLSSDGLHDYVDEKRIVDIVSTGKTAEEIARRLIEEVLPVTKDNVTVVVLV